MLSNLQIELIKTFSRPLPENQVLEIKQLLADYFSQKADEKMDALFEKNDWYANGKVDEWLGLPS